MIFTYLPETSSNEKTKTVLDFQFCFIDFNQYGTTLRYDGINKIILKLKMYELLPKTDAMK